MDFHSQSFNSFHAIGFFLHPLKTSANLWFSDVFGGLKKSCVMKWVDKDYFPKADREVNNKNSFIVFLEKDCLIPRNSCAFSILSQCLERLFSEYLQIAAFIFMPMDAPSKLNVHEMFIWPRAYSQPFQTSKLELFGRIVNRFSTNTQCVFHIETTRKRLFPRRFNWSIHDVFVRNYQSLTFFTKGSILDMGLNTPLLTLHKKWSFPLRISPVNVTWSAVNCGFGHIYWRNP